MERLTIDEMLECLGEYADHESAKQLIALIEKLKQYKDAEEQGLLIQLPCRIGDAVYIIVGKDISEQKVQRVTINSEGKIEFCTRKREFALFDFGKTVFLTKEDAETKLKGR